MRYHEPFTCFPRKMPSGLTVWYYRARLPDGSRSTAWSTGQTTRTAARAVCRQLDRDSKLIPSKEPSNNPPAMTFASLAKGFWSWEGEYVRTRLRFSDPKKPAISQVYCFDNARIVERHLLPTWGRRRVETITPQEIESFALRLRDGGLSGASVNNVISVMRTMLKEARRAGLLPWDPAQKGIIRAVGKAHKARGRLTVEEARALFAEEIIPTAWKGHLLYRAINFVGAATGCRQGELLALRGPDVHPEYLHIAHSWTTGFGLGPTKDRQVRDVPLPPRAYEAMRPFLRTGGFVFSMSDGEKPVIGNRVTEALHAALQTIGVDDTGRNICFHSWRHWLNSVLLARGVTRELVQAVTGHATDAMVENYKEFKAEDFGPVAAVQREVFA